jgi:hypothetical protein
MADCGLLELQNLQPDCGDDLNSRRGDVQRGGTMKKLILILGLLAAPAFGQYTIGQWTAAMAGTGGTPQASTPTFSPVSGSYGSTQTVTISASTGGVICYATSGTPATNGTTGCTTGTLYSGTVSVAATETLYAVAGGTGYTDSSVGSAAYTISAGGTPLPVGTPVCGHSSGVAIVLSYTPYAAGDAILATWSYNGTTQTLSSVTDNATGSSSTYTVLSGQTGQHGSARSLQLAYTLNVKAGTTIITATPSSIALPSVFCVQEFSNVSGVANLTGVSITGSGTYTTGTTPQCTIANSTDYVYLGGVGPATATSATGTNGTLTSNMYYDYAGQEFTWEHYALDAHPYGSINYAGGNMSLACVDVQ